MAEFPHDPQSGEERTASLHEGSNTRQVPWLLTPNMAVEVENLIIDELGVRSLRNGAKAFGGLHEASPPGGLAVYNTPDFDERLLSIWGNNSYISTGNGGWAEIACDVSMVSGLLHQFVRGRSGGELSIAWATCEEVTDPSVGPTGRSQLSIYRIETDAATQVSLAPRTITSFQNRLFYGEGETVGWSEIGDLGAFSDTNNLLIDPGVGGEITAILPARDADPRLLIFKERAIFLFAPRWGTDGGFIADLVAGDSLNLNTSFVRLLTQGTGCIATKTLQSVPDAEGSDVFFLAPDGVRSLNRADNDVQTGAGFPITHEIPGIINRINFDEAHKATASVFDNAYHLAVPLDGAKDNSHILRYDVRTQAWSVHTWESRDILTTRLGGSDKLFQQNAFRTADTSVTAPAAPAAFQVYSLYQNNFDQSTDETSVVRPLFKETSRAYVFQDPTQTKSWDRFMMQLSSAETAAVSVAFRVDQGSFNTATDIRISATGGSVVLGVDKLPWLSSDEVIRRHSIGLDDLTQPGRTFQVQLSGVTGATDAGQPSIYMTSVKAEVLTKEWPNDA